MEMAGIRMTANLLPCILVHGIVSSDSSCLSSKMFYDGVLNNVRAHARVMHSEMVIDRWSVQRTIMRCNPGFQAYYVP
jgi:hypothetical protein